MSDFKVGQRVRVTGYLHWQVSDAWTVQVSPIKGSIYAIDSHILVVELDTTQSRVRVFYKQCRRLKPAKKRRTVWVNYYPNGSAGAYFTKEEANKRRSCVTESAVEFIEVRPKRKGDSE